DCIIAIVDVDFSAVLENPPILAPSDMPVITLMTKDVRSDRAMLNHTPWQITHAIVLQRGDDPLTRAACA
ncbi:MAG: hypothetical protein ACRDRT_12595, partial [Pseudonocardiaceae bacterium]